MFSKSISANLIHFIFAFILCSVASSLAGCPAETFSQSGRGSTQEDDDIISKYYSDGGFDAAAAEALIREYAGIDNLEVVVLSNGSIVSNDLADFMHFSPLKIIHNDSELFVANELKGGHVSKYSITGEYLGEWNRDCVRQRIPVWSDLIPSANSGLLWVNHEFIADCNSIDIPNIYGLRNGCADGEKYYFVNYTGELADLRYRFLIFDREMNYLEPFAVFDSPLEEGRMSIFFNFTILGDHIYAAEEFSTHRYRVSLATGEVTAFPWASSLAREIAENNYKELKKPGNADGPVTRLFQPTNGKILSYSSKLIMGFSVHKRLPVFFIMNGDFEIIKALYIPFNKQDLFNLMDFAVAGENGEVFIYALIGSRMPAKGSEYQGATLFKFSIPEQPF